MLSNGAWRYNKVLGWLEEIEDAVLEHVANRFSPFDVLKQDSGRLAEAGVLGAWGNLEKRLQGDFFFPTRNSLQRWMNFEAYRESLRVVFEVKAVARSFASLDVLQKCLLRWSYVDQFSLSDVQFLIASHRHAPSREVVLPHSKELSVEQLIQDSYDSLMKNLDMEPTVKRNELLAKYFEHPFPVPPILKTRS